MAEDGCLFGGLEALRPIVQKSAVVIEATDDGEEDVVKNDDER